MICTWRNLVRLHRFLIDLEIKWRESKAIREKERERERERARYILKVDNMERKRERERTKRKELGQCEKIPLHIPSTKT